MISLRPSMTRSSSSSPARPSRPPTRSTARVRIWLILIHDSAGRPSVRQGSVRGKPAGGSRLVRATAITVPERWLKYVVAQDEAGLVAHGALELWPVHDPSDALVPVVLARTPLARLTLPDYIILQLLR